MKKTFSVLLLFSIISVNMTYPMNCSKKKLWSKKHVRTFLLHEAAQEGTIKTVKYLLNKKLTVNAQDANGNTPLHYAAQEGHIEIVRLLLAHGAEHLPNKHHNLAYDIAQMKGHTEVASILERHWVNYMFSILQ